MPLFPIVLKFYWFSLEKRMVIVEKKEGGADNSQPWEKTQETRYKCVWIYVEYPTLKMDKVREKSDGKLWTKRALGGWLTRKRKNWKVVKF